MMDRHNKVIRWASALAVVGAALLIGTAGLAQSARPSSGLFRVCVEDKEQFPNFIGNSAVLDANYPGVSFEMINDATRRAGLVLDVARMPWKRCLQMLERGKVDGASDASFKEDRRVLGRYPEKDGMIDPARRIDTIAYSLYRAKGSPISWDGKNLTNVAGMIGAPIGYSIVDDLKALGVTVDESSATMIDLSKLANGRLAAVAALRPAADYILQRDRSVFQAIERIDPPLVTKDYFLMISHQFYRDHSKVAEAIWNNIAHLRQTDHERLMQKYLTMPGAKNG